MARRKTTKEGAAEATAAPVGRPSALLDTRVIYCGDCLDQLQRLPDGCVDLIYIDPPESSNCNYEVFWGETKEKRAFEDRHASTHPCIEYMQPPCAEPSWEAGRTAPSGLCYSVPNRYHAHGDGERIASAGPQAAMRKETA